MPFAIGTMHEILQRDDVLTCPVCRKTCARERGEPASFSERDADGRYVQRVVFLCRLCIRRHEHYTVVAASISRKESPR